MSSDFYSLEFHNIDVGFAKQLLDDRKIPFRVRPGVTLNTERLVVRSTLSYDLHDVYDIVHKGGINPNV